MRSYKKCLLSKQVSGDYLCCITAAAPITVKHYFYKHLFKGIERVDSMNSNGTYQQDSLQRQFSYASEDAPPSPKASKYYTESMKI